MPTLALSSPQRAVHLAPSPSEPSLEAEQSKPLLDFQATVLPPTPASVFFSHEYPVKMVKQTQPEFL